MQPTEIKNFTTMPVHNDQLLPLPVIMTKEKFYRAYYPMGQNFLRAEINRIICEIRREHFPKFKDFDDARLRQTQTIFQIELIEFAKIYNLPDGYTYPPNYEQDASSKKP